MNQPFAYIFASLLVTTGLACERSRADEPTEKTSTERRSSDPQTSDETAENETGEGRRATTSKQSESTGHNDMSGTVTTDLTMNPPLLRAISSKRRGILGREAPGFRLDDWIGSDGSKKAKPIEQNDLQGKFVFMLFWQSWCPGCHERGFPTLRKVSRHFSDDPKVVCLAIQTVFEGFSVNTADKIHDVREEFDLRVPMAHDDGSQHGADRSYVMDQYQTGGTPWIVILDPSGRVVFNDFHIGPERAIEYLERHTG